MYTLRKHIHTRQKPPPTHTHTWAWVETELRRTLQGVDEWGLAKLPRGVQISSIHKQHSGPCGEERGGWRELTEKKKVHNSWRRRERKTRSERQTYRENMWSQVRRKDWHRETSYRDWNGIQRANFFHRPHPQLDWWHSSEWVYGLMDYQRVWHNPFLAQAWSISWQAQGWEASQSRRASSQLSLVPRAGPNTLAIFNSPKTAPGPRRLVCALLSVRTQAQKVDSVCLSL